jgi:hypothetical protein
MVNATAEFGIRERFEWRLMGRHEDVPMPVSPRSTIKVILSLENPAPRDMIPRSATPVMKVISVC